MTEGRDKKTDVDALRAEAEKLMRADDNAPALRSCWDCNGAHEHLRDAEYVILCPWCSRWFLRGVDITIWEVAEREST